MPPDILHAHALGVALDEPIPEPKPRDTCHTAQLRRDREVLLRELRTSVDRYARLESAYRQVCDERDWERARGNQEEARANGERVRAERWRALCVDAVVVAVLACVGVIVLILRGGC
jgi:hypothetical protein